MNRMVADVLASPVISVQPGTSFKGMIQLLDEHQISALPVVDSQGHLLGIVSETDLLRKEEHPPRDPTRFVAGFSKSRKPAEPAGTTAADYMSTPVITIPPGASLASAARLLHEHNVRHLPVVGPDGKVVGIVARRDLLSVFLQADAAIRHKIITAVLRQTFNLPAGAIEVDVDDGVVTLTGCVPWHSTARETLDRVRALDGVVDVVDRLSWAHDDTANHAATPWAGS
jgi:CBS domain-containing protein